MKPISRRERDRAYREANAARIAERKRAYYIANAAKIAERGRKRYAANAARIAERQRKYYEANAQKILDQKRSYYEANAAKIAERKRKHYEATGEKQREQKRRYRAANLEKLRERDRKYHTANAEQRREGCRKRYRKDPTKMANYNRYRKYGITAEQFGAMLRMQGGRCAICKSDKPGGKHDWHVDHCHSSGKARGILCHHCNQALSGARDNPDTLRAALRYLDEAQRLPQGRFHAILDLITP
jgi:hypothetical protein